MQQQTLTLRATAIAIERERQPTRSATDVTDIQRLLAWYFEDSTRPERRDAQRRRAA